MKGTNDRWNSEGSSQPEVEGINDQRWRVASRGGGERSEVEGSHHRRREAIRGGGEQFEVEGSDWRWRGAIRGGGQLSEVEASHQSRGATSLHIGWGSITECTE